MASVQFLTVIPVKTEGTPDNQTMRGAIAMFPVIGILIGIIAAVSNSLFSMALPGNTASVLTVIVMTLLTGGLHKDGIADTADGLFGGRDAAKRLDIMRDSRIGTFGVIALIADFLLKVALITAIPSKFKTAALIMMPLAGRWGMVLALYLFKYARTEGKAKAFFENTTTKVFSIATALVFVPAFFLAGFKGLAAAVLAGIGAYTVGNYIEKKINGMTGDTLGAVNEICEILALMTIAAMAGIK